MLVVTGGGGDPENKENPQERYFLIFFSSAKKHATLGSLISTAQVGKVAERFSTKKRKKFEITAGLQMRSLLN